MSERYISFSISAILAVAPCFTFAATSPELRFLYGQSTVINGANYVKVAFDRLATNAAGSLTSVGQYVSYIRPTATMIARVVLPRLLLAASGVGTIALVGYGIYELWQYMKDKGYTYDSETKEIVHGSGQKTATVEEVNKVTGDFLNNDHYYSGGFSISLDSNIFTGSSAQTVCTQYMNAFKQKGNYQNVSSCTFTGANCGTNNSSQKGFLFKATYSTNGTNAINTQGCVIAYTAVNTYPPKAQEKPKVVTSTSLADHIANETVLPESVPNFISDFKNSNKAAYDSVLQSVFNPAFPEAQKNIEDAKIGARPSYNGEVSTSVPSGAVGATDQVVTIPNTDVTTKNPDGTVNQSLPAFCSWAPSICNMADKFLATTTPENTKMPEINPTVTVSDRLNVIAQCPAPKRFNYFGQSFDISYDFVCSFAETIRPIVLIAGYLGSAFIVIRRI
ncbi:virulence factor TspB C-terminal domain-related protein (plasmid) [Acinetobacter baumannii]|nr:virulence factor TspB C-terminal domain-related protein [Acinetobacter baumannii]